MAPTDLHPHYGLTLTRGMHDAGYQYNRHVGAPLSVDQTPRPATQEEVRSISLASPSAPFISRDLNRPRVSLYLP